MSRRTWCSVFDRTKLARRKKDFNDLVEFALRMEVDDDSSDDDSSDDDSSFGSSDGSVVYDTLLAFGELYLEQLEHNNRPISHDIVYGRRLRIEDFSDSECLIDFRFRKNDLQTVADALWPRLKPFLNDNKEHISLENKYHAPYETILLV
jgi:hypothetical protein